MLTGLRALPSTVWLLGLISLVNDSASELVYPLIPLYLSAVMQAGPRFLGLLEGVAEALTAVLKLYSGILSDRFQTRKWPAVIGYFFAAIARPLYAFAGSATGVFALRIIDRTGKALRSGPRDAMLMAAVAPSQRGLAFGLHRSMDHAGALIGPLLALALISAGADLRTVLLWAAVPGALCVALALSIREPQAHVLPLPVRTTVRDWRWRALPPAFQRYLLALSVFSLGNASKIFLLLRARDAGLSITQTLLCWAGMALIASVLTTPLSALSDRVSRRLILGVGWLLQAALCLAFALLPADFTTLLVLFAGFGVLSAATEGVEKALVADLLDQEQKATSFGWFYLASGLPLLPASIGFGWLWEAYSPVVAFIVSAVFALAGVLLLLPHSNSKSNS
jgi:MFS family permease